MRGFVVFSDNWGGHTSSCQHLFQRIIGRHPVIWVNTVMRWPRLSMTDLSKVAGKLKSWCGPAPKEAESDAPRPMVLNPPLWPQWDNGLARRFNVRQVAGALDGPLAEYQAEYVAQDQTAHQVDRWVMLSTIPVTGDIFDAFPDALKVYYCVDEYAEWPGHGRDAMMASEARLLERVDLVMATSRHLQRRKSCPGGATQLLDHGVDVAHFSGGHGGREWVAKMGIEPAAQVVGFFGLLDERIDQDLVIAVARARPDSVFLFVGPCAADMGRLQALPNIHLFPAVPYGELPHLASGFDVAWLPYLINDLTVNINPLKLKEYLALGCPVLSTPLPEVQALSDHVTVAADAHDCAHALAEWQQAPPVPSPATAAFVATQSWEAKADQMLAWIETAETTRFGADGW